MLKTKFCDLFGVEYPIVCAGMGNIALASLAAAVSEAGGLGTIALPGLSMRHFSDAAVDAYLADEAEQVIDCVGGYRIEAAGSQLFDAIEGDYFSVLGLPLLPLLKFLRQHGVLTS